MFKTLKTIHKMPKIALIGGLIGLGTMLFLAPMVSYSMTINEYLDLVSYRLFDGLSRLCRFDN